MIDRSASPNPWPWSRPPHIPQADADRSFALPPPVSLRRLVSRPVRDERGRLIGEIVDVVLDAETGCIAYVVIALAHASGPRREVALPWDAMRVAGNGDHLVSTALRHTLDRPAPACLRTASPS